MSCEFDEFGDDLMDAALATFNVDQAVQQHLQTGSKEQPSNNSNRQLATASASTVSAVSPPVVEPSSKKRKVSLSPGTAAPPTPSTPAPATTTTTTNTTTKTMIIN